jgi:hypothetical protein
VGEQGAGAQSWPENAQSWARPRWGDRGREVRDALIGGVGGGRERGSGRARVQRRRQADPTGRQESEGERTLGFAPTGEVRLSGIGTGGRARVGWA